MKLFHAKVANEIGKLIHWRVLYSRISAWVGKICWWIYDISWRFEIEWLRMAKMQAGHNQEWIVDIVAIVRCGSEIRFDVSNCARKWDTQFVMFAHFRTKFIPRVIIVADKKIANPNIFLVSKKSNGQTDPRVSKDTFRRLWWSTDDGLNLFDQCNLSEQRDKVPSSSNRRVCRRRFTCVEDER